MESSAKVARRVGLLFVALCALAGAAWAADPSFQRLASLAGNWSGTGPQGVAAQFSYQLTGGGSTLIETIQTTGYPSTATVYHSDGKTTSATHYCSMGGSADQGSVIPGNPDPNMLAIQFDTNQAPAQMNYVMFQFIDASHVNATWGLRNGSGETSFLYQLMRVP
jgi:hypothetical protein